MIIQLANQYGAITLRNLGELLPAEDDDYAIVWSYIEHRIAACAYTYKSTGDLEWLVIDKRELPASIKTAGEFQEWCENANNLPKP